MAEVVRDGCEIDERIDGTNDSAPAVRIQVLEADLERLRDQISGLRRSQDDRAVVEQAKGAVMAMTGCAPDEAFGLMRSVSQRTNRKLVDVAQELVAQLRRGAVVVGPALMVDPTKIRWREQPRTGSWRSRTDFSWQLRSVRDGDQLRALVDLAAHLSAAGGWDDLIAAVVQRGLAALGARAGALAVLGQDDCLDTWSCGYPRDIARPYDRVPLSADVPLAVCVREHRPLYHRTRAQILERFQEIPLQIDTQALAVVPLVHEGVSLGALGLSYDIPQEFDPGTRAFLEFAAQECALALVRVKDEAGPPIPT